MATETCRCHNCLIRRTLGRRMHIKTVSVVVPRREIRGTAPDASLLPSLAGDAFSQVSETHMSDAVTYQNVMSRQNISLKNNKRLHLHFLRMIRPVRFLPSGGTNFKEN
jgi:hypothetical protein